MERGDNKTNSPWCCSQRIHNPARGQTRNGGLWAKPGRNTGALRGSCWWGQGSWWSCSTWKKVVGKGNKEVHDATCCICLKLAFFSFYFKPLISRACLSWRPCLFAYRLSDAFIKWATALLITTHQGGLRADVFCHPTVRQHLLKFWSHMSLENGLCFLSSLTLDDLHVTF